MVIGQSYWTEWTERSETIECWQWWAISIQIPDMYSSFEKHFGRHVRAGAILEPI